MRGLVSEDAPRVSASLVLQGGTIRNYWSCLDRSIVDSRHVKSIVNTAHALAARYAASCSSFSSRHSHLCTAKSLDIFHSASVLD